MSLEIVGGKRREQKIYPNMILSNKNKFKKAFLFKSYLLEKYSSFACNSQAFKIDKKALFTCNGIWGQILLKALIILLLIACVPIGPKE